HGHGDARAADAGHQGQRLRQPDQYGVGDLQVLQLADGHADAVGDQQHDGEDDLRPGDDLHQSQLVGDGVLQQEAGGAGGQGGQQHQAHEPGAGIAAARGQAQGAQCHAGDVAPEIEADGQQGADVAGDVEYQFLAGPEVHRLLQAAEDLPGQDQVRRG